jgi:hypothetical protein
VKVFIWLKGSTIASVTNKLQLVIGKLKRDGMKSEDSIEVWENEKKIDVYYTASELMNSLKPIEDEDENDNKTFW